MTATRKDIDALLAFLPLIRQAPGSAYFSWGGDTADADGRVQMPHVTYADWVVEFFALGAKPCWTDPEYQPQAAARMVADDASIATAGQRELRTMLTFCVRGERFCAGHWIAMIDEGRLVAILERLRSLATQRAGRRRKTATPNDS